MRIVVETKKLGSEQEDRQIEVWRGELGTAPKIVITIDGRNFYISPEVFEGIL